MRAKGVSMQTIADKLGLSKMTVSRVLSGNGYAGDDTAEKVLNMARALGYFRADPRDFFSSSDSSKSTSSSLPVNSSPKLAILCEARELALNASIFSELCAQFSNLGARVYLKVVDCFSKPSDFVSAMREDGFEMVFSLGVSKALMAVLDAATREGMKVVALEQNLDSTLRRAKFSTLVFDRLAEFNSLISHLSACGIKSIALIQSMGKLPIKDIENICEKNTINISIFVSIDSQNNDSIGEAKNIFSSFNIPDVILCLDAQSLEYLLPSMEEYGRAAPDDFLLICVDDLRSRDYFENLSSLGNKSFYANISSLICDWHEVAKQVMDFFKNYNAGDNPSKIELAERKLVERESSQRVKKSLVWVL